MLPSAITAYSASIEQNSTHSGNIITRYVAPTRIVWVSDSLGLSVSNPQYLLSRFSGQISVADTHYTVMRSTNAHQASILLDFGTELQGGIEISSSLRDSKAPIALHVRFGESVTEAMSSIGDGDGATNEHSLRDFTVSVPWIGNLKIGNSGFRFVRIDLLDKDTNYNLKAVRAIAQFRDLAYSGSFESDNPRLNSIWAMGAHTVHLNMQDYLWDGIKRDRLVWVGDIHPEVMTINSVFGESAVLHRSLDFARDDTPLPGWMNGISSYSMWWMIIHRDLYMYQGDLQYLKAQHAYLRALVRQICSKIDDKGNEHFDGNRFLNWPTSENKDVVASGLHFMCYMALNAAREMATVLDDAEMARLCDKTLQCLRRQDMGTFGNKEAAALKIISGLSHDTARDAKVILKNGANGFSTFFGFYMIDALAKSGNFDEAIDIISKYWGAMIDLGATTFWEELNYADVKNAARIDEFVPTGKFDIHAHGGAYCYKGLRMSLCHGWASGPTSWLSKYVLGVCPTAPGCSQVLIEPHLSGCSQVKGTFPTPAGVLSVSHHRDSKGIIHSTIVAPRSIKVITKNTVLDSLTYTD